MEKKIRVLFITHAPWRNDTSIGNSYSNIFYKMDDRFEFAQIYIRDGVPENNLVHDYFCISEKELLKSIFTRKPVGKQMTFENKLSSKPIKFSKKYNVIRSLRWDFFLLARDVATSLGNWKTNELDKFLEDYNPDIIFGALSFIPLVNKLMLYAKEKTKAELITYPWDDWYRINSNAISPFYYARIHLERHYIKKCANKCRYLYTITEQMKDEYEIVFGKSCKVLRKGYDFTYAPQITENIQKDLKLIYAGNIGDNRWKVLAAIAQAISKSNSKNETKMCQYIYTLTPITNEMKNKLEVSGASKLMGGVSSSEISDIMDSADILIHVEPTDKIKLENCRLSFSTKIVDYLYKGKCILAVGGENASMKYLKNNDAAIVVNNMDELNNVLQEICNNPELVNEYGKKARECGIKNHDINKIQNMIYEDFYNAINRRGEK